MSMENHIATAKSALAEAERDGDAVERSAVRAMLNRLNELLERRRTGVDPVTRREEPCPTARARS